MNTNFKKGTLSKGSKYTGGYDTPQFEKSITLDPEGSKLLEEAKSEK